MNTQPNSPNEVQVLNVANIVSSVSETKPQIVLIDNDLLVEDIEKIRFRKTNTKIKKNDSEVTITSNSPYLGRYEDGLYFTGVTISIKSKENKNLTLCKVYSKTANPLLHGLLYFINLINDLENLVIKYEGFLNVCKNALYTRFRANFDSLDYNQKTKFVNEMYSQYKDKYKNPTVYLEACLNYGLEFGYYHAEKLLTAPTIQDNKVSSTIGSTLDVYEASFKDDVIKILKKIFNCFPKKNMLMMLETNLNYWSRYVLTGNLCPKDCFLICILSNNYENKDLSIKLEKTFTKTEDSLKGFYKYGLILEKYPYYQITSTLDFYKGFKTVSSENSALFTTKDNIIFIHKDIFNYFAKSKINMLIFLYLVYKEFYKSNPEIVGDIREIIEQEIQDSLVSEILNKSIKEKEKILLEKERDFNKELENLNVIHKNITNLRGELLVEKEQKDKVSRDVEKLSLISNFHKVEDICVLPEGLFIAITLRPFIYTLAENIHIKKYKLIPAAKMLIPYVLTDKSIAKKLNTSSGKSNFRMVIHPKFKEMLSALTSRFKETRLYTNPSHIDRFPRFHPHTIIEFMIRWSEPNKVIQELLENELNVPYPSICFGSFQSAISEAILNNDGNTILQSVISNYYSGINLEDQWGRTVKTFPELHNPDPLAINLLSINQSQEYREFWLRTPKAWDTMRVETTLKGSVGIYDLIFDVSQTDEVKEIKIPFF